MRFGLFYLISVPEDGDGAQVYRQETGQMELAEQLGYDGIWIGEHHFSPYGTVGSAIALSAYVAGRTSRIRIGQAVNVLPFAHPVRLAEDAAMVDILSGGRLNFGIGRGYSALEYGGLGISMDESRDRFDESVDIILGAWTKPSFSYDGKHFQLPATALYPRPVQQPHPPIWMACTSPPTISWAAERGFAYLQDHMQPVANLAEARQTYRGRARETQGAETAERLLKDSAVLRFVYLDEDDSRARAEPEPYVLWYQSNLAKYGTSAREGAYSSAYSFQQQMAAKSRERDYPWYVENVALFGDPSRVIDGLQQLRDSMGLEHVILWTNFGGMSDEQARRNLRLFAERVAPYV
jgi:alkanesulfonate monooxygenase SsuD/methylene tetrahydromethanopterin reductase-like flavin-dependent oxidoreductase (luciferase family)